MGVHENRQGNGHRKFLVEAAFRLALAGERIHGCRSMVVDPKEKAMAFYPKFGFKPFSQRPGRLYSTIDEIARWLNVER